MFEEYRHPDIFMASGYPLEFDYYYPAFNLAIEYQGHQHYKNTHMNRTSVEENKKIDETKASLSKKKGVFLNKVVFI